jgi:tRNA(Ile)-lysidine synthase
LLLALDDLLKTRRFALKLTVAHLDHGLRGKAGAEDARWVELLAEGLGFPFELGRVAVKKLAEDWKDNLEQAARRARYEFLVETAERLGARLILTGHTLDDQAETVLLRLLRGSGAEGLSGIEPVRRVEADRDVLLVRPLVGWARRALTEKYCRERGVEFRADVMNEDERFARVRVRRRLLPLLESFNPRVVEALARTAELLREDSAVLNAAAEELLEAASAGGKDEKGASIPAALDVNVLACAPEAVRRRALRLWIRRGRGDLRRLELAHLAGVEKLLEGERGGRIAELPGGSFVERRRGRLFLKSRIQNSGVRIQKKRKT